MDVHWSDTRRVRDLVATARPEVSVRAAEPVAAAVFQAAREPARLTWDDARRIRHAALDAGYPVEAVNEATRVWLRMQGS